MQTVLNAIPEVESLAHINSKTAYNLLNTKGAILFSKLEIFGLAGASNSR